MARHYSTTDFFRQMPNALLARYFHERELFDELDFVLSAKDALPNPPMSHIFVKTSTSSKEGLIFLTPPCVSAVELEEQVKRLKKELDDILTIGKKKYAKQANI